MSKLKDLKDIIDKLDFYDKETWIKDYPQKSVGKYLRLFEHTFIKETPDKTGVILAKPKRSGEPSRRGYILWKTMPKSIKQYKTKEQK